MDIPVKEWLWPNWATFTTTLLVLAFSYYLFRKHLFGPTREFMKKRSNFIDKNIKDSIQAKDQAQKELDNAQKEFDKSIKDAASYLEGKMSVADQKAQQLIDNTKADLSQLKETTREALSNAEAEARKNLKKEVAEISIAAASKVLQREIDEKDSAKLVDDFIKDIN